MTYDILPWIFIFWMAADLLAGDPTAAIVTGSIYIAGIYCVAFIRLVRKR